MTHYAAHAQGLRPCLTMQARECRNMASLTTRASPQLDPPSCDLAMIVIRMQLVSMLKYRDTRRTTALPCYLPIRQMAGMRRSTARVCMHACGGIRKAGSHARTRAVQDDSPHRRYRQVHGATLARGHTGHPRVPTTHAQECTPNAPKQTPPDPTPCVAHAAQEVRPSLVAIPPPTHPLVLCMQPGTPHAATAPCEGSRSLQHAMNARARDVGMPCCPYVPTMLHAALLAAAPGRSCRYRQLSVSSSTGGSQAG